MAISKNIGQITWLFCIHVVQDLIYCIKHSSETESKRALECVTIDTFDGYIWEFLTLYTKKPYNLSNISRNCHMPFYMGKKLQRGCIEQCTTFDSYIFFCGSRGLNMFGAFTRICLQCSWNVFSLHSFFMLGVVINQSFTCFYAVFCIASSCNFLPI